MKVKITSIAIAKELVDKLGSDGHRFSVYFGNQSIHQHYVYYRDSNGWHSYYAEQNSRSTDVRNHSAETVAKVLYRNRSQFNDLYYDSVDGFVS